ncbi:hypothetical protein KKE60_06285 [Patescibacteria group bacterium]|nr:hypothetical protein [Patescibacteria group bacterium]
MDGDGEICWVGENKKCLRWEHKDCITVSKSEAKCKGISVPFYIPIKGDLDTAIEDNILKDENE